MPVEKLQQLAMPFDTEQLELFEALPIPEESWSGLSPRRWVHGVLGQFATEANLVPDTQLRRHELREFCAADNNSDSACFLAVMAWGGMRRDHARLAWQQRLEWLPAVHAIRNENFTRAAAYKLFADLRPLRLPGIGPAYFTKLLFFLRVTSDCYILDQWTAKSVHVLTGQRERPGMTKGKHRAASVSDNVSPTDYEDYCDLVDELAARANVTGQLMEQKLFCKGGRSPGLWRSHVRNTW